MEATRFPSDYDGMVGGAAPWKWTALMFGHTWNSMPAMKDQSALTAQSVVVLNRGMIKACDKLDGLEDGIIADPRRCKVDPVQFQCGDTNKGECLTPVQVEAARHIYAGAKKSDGTVLMPGQVRGGELGWLAQSGGATPGGSSWDFWRQAVFQDPNFQNVNFDFDRDTERALATKVSGSSLADVYDEKPNLDGFKARGGKFIFFQGWADPVITPMMDVDFYDRIVARYGQAKTDDFFRFFPLAGMGHCSGGAGFSHIGGATGAPIKDDPDHDMVKALDKWVTSQGSALRCSSRPMSMTQSRSPPRARSAAIRWKRTTAATATPANAANFTCRAPGPLPPQPM